MKKFGLIKLCLLVCMNCFVHAQQVLLNEPRPYIENVTVHPETGLITIYWDVPDPPDTRVEDFVIFWYKKEIIDGKIQSTNLPFARISDPDVRSYTFDYDTIVVRDPMMPDPRKTSVSFSVGSESHTLDLKSLRSYEHYNTQIASSFDSCKIEIKVNWYQYMGWNTNQQPNYPFESYTLMRIPEGGGQEEVLTVLPSQKDTSFIIQNVTPNTTYTLYVEAKRKDGRTATSYRTTQKTKMLSPPSYVNALNTQYNDEGFAEIRFKIDPSAETHLYQFSGTSHPDHAFVSLATLNIFSSDTTLTDAQLRDHTYYYKLEAWHVCLNNFTATSNIATALWLSVEQGGMVNSLQWDAFQKWENTDAKYEIYRKIGDGSNIILASISDQSKLNYNDNLADIEIDGAMCYWIKATPMSPNSSNEYAISNTVCVKPEPAIYVPQAFTPSSNDDNSLWKPSFIPILPDEYLLILYDRTGAKVFETKNPEEGWNGKFLNGKNASEGVYVYYMRYKTAVGRVIEKKGTLSLILP